MSFIPVFFPSGVEIIHGMPSSNLDIRSHGFTVVILIPLPAPVKLIALRFLSRAEAVSVQDLVTDPSSYQRATVKNGN
jgi:hypothetical protein